MIALRMFLKKLFILTVLLILSGCQTVDLRGQFISDNVVNEINSKKLNKSEVINLVGTPTYVPDYTDNTWYYIQRSLTRRAWFEPKVVSQRIVQIAFEKNNKVIGAILQKDTQKEDIKIEPSYTKTYGTEKNIIQSFVKNIARFNKTIDRTTKQKKER